MANYYKRPDRARALEVRLKAIHRNVVFGRVLDIGCNDGRITKTLLDECGITGALGVDLEVMHNHFPVLQQNVMDLNLEDLGEFENILYLNVHHHVMAAANGSNAARAQQILDGLLSSCRVLLFEMGSVTEQLKSPWLRSLKRRFQTDGHSAEAIFGKNLYFEIASYPMHGGVRKMYKVIGNAPDTWTVKNLQWYARNRGTVRPHDKRFIKVNDLLHRPFRNPAGARKDDLMKHVCFATFIHNRKAYFAKKCDSDRVNVASTFKLYNELRHTRFAGQILQPLYYSQRFGMVWPYDPELMQRPYGGAVVVSFRNVDRFIESPEQRENIKQLMDCHASIDGQWRPVRAWCEFQTVVTSNGLRFIDFDVET
ncbi:MAG: class I SAM-dependent methyltransferase [Verrucomicrobiae bacterium]|nr:class I SAM-dependent methyltransferase [Verrucomicrobiae bacterium]